MRLSFLGEAKWSTVKDAAGDLAELERKAERLPIASGRRIFTALWVPSAVRGRASPRIVTARRVLEVMR